MAGHNKWSKVKHIKKKVDKKKSKLFSKLTREIMVAVREGGPDPEHNARLKNAIDNAKGMNMPKKNIKRAIKRVVEGAGEDYEKVIYEGYGPGGIAIIVECTTENINRTVGNVRHIFEDFGGSLGDKGSVQYMFERKGIFNINKDRIEDWDEEELFLEVIDAGASDMDTEGDDVMITTSMEVFGDVKKKFEELGIKPNHAALEFVPRQGTMQIINQKAARKVMELIEELEEDDDVQNVFHNMELSDQMMNELVGEESS